MITLDVQNVRKSLTPIGVSSYLTALVDSYLTDRRFWYDTDSGTKEYVLPALVPQGSVLGLLLWNIIYNDVLNVPVASETTIVGYADDLAVIVVAKRLADVELYSSEAITAIKKRLEDPGLALAEDKTEVSE